MTELVTITVEDGVADVRLNRADKYNALSPEMFAAITEAGEKVATLPGVRVVVLSGEGRGFCAGLDFSSFKGMATGSGSPARKRRWARLRVRSCRKITPSARAWSGSAARSR